jgi:hypothetical protein
LDKAVAHSKGLAGIVAISAGGSSSAYLPVHVLQAVLASDSAPKLWFLTRGAQAVGAQAPALAPDADDPSLDDLELYDLVEAFARIASTVQFDRLGEHQVFDDDTPTAGVRFFDSVNYSVSSPLVTGADRRQVGITFGYAF